MKQVTTILLFFVFFALSAVDSFGQKGNNNNPGAPNTVGCDIFIPNAFTPNGDGLNDRFTIRASEICNIQEFNIKIFDRWGSLVYETNSPDPEKAWDGLYDSQEARQGVYMFNVYARIIPASGNDKGNVIRKQGTLVLIR